MGIAITLSRQLGSGGDQIACSIAAELGFRVVGRGMVHEALQGCMLEEIPLDVDRSDPSLVQRVSAFLQGTSAIPAELQVFNLSEPGVLSTRLFSSDEYYRSVLESVLYDMAQMGNIVVVGQAGQVILRDGKHTFHSRIVAPLEQRVASLQKQFGVDEDEAQRKIKTSDQARAQYLRRHYHVDIDDASQYDLVINTRTLSIESASRLILDAILASGLLAGARPDTVSRRTASV